MASSMRLLFLAADVATTFGQELFLSKSVQTPKHNIPMLEHFHPERKRTIRSLLGDSYSVGHEVTASRVFRPQDFGADPSGHEDSFDAMTKAFQALLGVGENSDNGFLDLGGATLDLAGGHFSVGQPLVVPKGYMNFKIGGGTISARNGTFPAGATLFTIGDASAEHDRASLFVDLSHLVLDGRGVVSTALALLNVNYPNLGPALMIYGFTDFGVKSDGSGSGYLYKSWLGQIPPGMHWQQEPLPTATAISLENNQHDWYVEDVIVWNAEVGLRSENAANFIQGLHSWGMTTQKGGIGIYLASGSGTVTDCYMDFVPLVIVDPVNVVVSNTLFLATANLVIEAGNRKSARSMVLSGNRWNSESNPKYKNETIIVRGDISVVEDCVIENNAIDRMWDVKSTRASKTVEVNNSSEVVLDFADDLLFNVPISDVSCQVQAWEFVQHIVQPPSDRSVKVLLSKPLAKGKVSCSVDQSVHTHAGH